MLSWEGTPILGAEAISEKLTVSFVRGCFPERGSFTIPYPEPALPESPAQGHNSRCSTIVALCCELDCQRHRTALGTRIFPHTIACCIYLLIPGR